MSLQSEYVVVFVTAKDSQEAEKIAQGLLEKKLAACANILDSLRSVFWWEGRVDRANEVLLVIKTRIDVMEQLITIVKSLHSYDTPEIIALPIIGGSRDYLAWIGASVKPCS
ncbi:MAG: divalent-cation tolerance protein CutA [Candidatus Omnitrophica bacterium]|nr:divalent-cation tolerance protein CutA [Candidatus Omnitrophota bacterium]